MKYILTILICLSMGLTADGTIGGVTYFVFIPQGMIFLYLFKSFEILIEKPW